MTDVRRLAEMLARVARRITVKRLARVLPLAVPMLLEIGRVSVYGAAIDTLRDVAAAEALAQPDAQSVLP